jgi:hypothetical protein
MKLDLLSLWKFLKYVIEIIDDGGNISVRRTLLSVGRGRLSFCCRLTDSLKTGSMILPASLIELMCGDSSEQSYPGPSPWSLSVGWCL